jgi:hypothetical protein
MITLVTELIATMEELALLWMGRAHMAVCVLMVSKEWTARL